MSAGIGSQHAPTASTVFHCHLSQATLTLNLKTHGAAMPELQLDGGVALKVWPGDSNCTALELSGAGNLVRWKDGRVTKNTSADDGHALLYSRIRVRVCTCVCFSPCVFMYVCIYK